VQSVARAVTISAAVATVAAERKHEEVAIVPLIFGNSFSGYIGYRLKFKLLETNYSRSC
jgi:hypothetical protein